MPWSRLINRPESTDRNWLTTVAADPQDHRVEVFRVAAVCDVCGKGPGFGMSVSHSHRRTNRRWNPNIQKKRYWVPSLRRNVTLNLSAKGIKVIDARGIDSVVNELIARGEKI